MHPLVFESYFRPCVWGGRRFQEVLHRPLPDHGTYGEAWDLSLHPHHISRVLDGPEAGRSLAELWERHSTELWGPSLPANHEFPLLIKLLDCEQPLSVQVHPDEVLVRRFWPKEAGKAEAWVCLEADPQARVYAGLKPGTTREQLQEHLQQGRVVDCLHAFVPRPGDCVLIRPGTVHAIEGGVLLVEVQLSSDTTFRLYDWDRPGLDGLPRELHLEAALQAIDWSLGPVNPLQAQPMTAINSNTTRERLVDSPYFHLERFTTERSFEQPYQGRLSVWTVLNGTARLEVPELQTSRVLNRGSTVLIPASCPKANWNSSTRLQLLGVTI